MDFMGYVKEGIEIVKLNKKSISKIAKDKKAFRWAMIFFLIGGVASAIGRLNMLGIVNMLLGIVITPISALIWSFISYGVVHLLAKIFGGTASFREFYSASGIGSILTWVSVVPFKGSFLSFLASLWGLVVTFFVLKTVHKLSSVRAGIVTAIIIFIMIVLFVVAIIGMMIGLGLGGLAGTELLRQLPTW